MRRRSAARSCFLRRCLGWLVAVVVEAVTVAVASEPAARTGSTGATPVGSMRRVARGRVRPLAHVFGGGRALVCCSLGRREPTASGG